MYKLVLITIYFLLKTQLSFSFEEIDWKYGSDGKSTYAAFSYPKLIKITKPGILLYCKGKKELEVVVNFSSYKAGNNVYQLSLVGRYISDPEKLYVKNPSNSGNPFYKFTGRTAINIANLIYSNPGGVVNNNIDKFYIPRNGIKEAFQTINSCL